MYICIHMPIYTYVHLDMINLCRGGFIIPLSIVEEYRNTQESGSILGFYQPPAGGSVRGGAGWLGIYTYVQMPI